MTIAELPAKPTQADARAAAEELNRLLDVFPVVSKAHRSSLLAALLTPLASAAIRGPSPLFLLDAPGDGIGATQAAEILGGLLCGRSITRMEKPSGERQFRRQLARLKAPDNGLILIEGAEEFRAAASISTALQSWQWTDGPEQRERRRLTWFARSSNAEVTREAAEGLLPIRFFDTDDHVRESSFDWPHPLDAWVDAQRPRFVRAALVLLRAYLGAGKPAQPRAAWQRFTGWSELVAGALVWVGLEDPIVARRSLAAAIGDEDASGVRALVVAIGRICPAETGLTTRDIVRRIGEEGPWALVREALRALLPGKALDARHVGNVLRKFRGVSVEGVFLHRVGRDRLGFARWTVERSPLVAAALASLHKYAEAPDPETTRVRVDDPRALVDRVADYALARAPAAVVAARPPAAAMPPARGESAESVRARSVPVPATAVLAAHVTRAESAESVRAKSVPPVSPGSARSLIPNFDAELEKVAASLLTGGGLNPLLTPPAFVPRWNGKVRPRSAPAPVGGR